MRKQINWQTSYPTERGNYLVTVQINGERYVTTDKVYEMHDGRTFWCGYAGAIVAWCKLSDVLPYDLDERVKTCEKILTDNGIDNDEAYTVMQAIGFALFDKDIYED